MESSVAVLITKNANNKVTWIKIPNESSISHSGGRVGGRMHTYLYSCICENPGLAIQILERNRRARYM